MYRHFHHFICYSFLNYKIKFDNDGVLLVCYAVTCSKGTGLMELQSFMCDSFRENYYVNIISLKGASVT